MSPLWDESILRPLTFLELHRADRERLGLFSDPLRLRRAWPRSPYHLGLEYVDAGGRPIAGQWFGDSLKLRRVARATMKCSGSAGVVSIPERGILLQAGGADRRLPGLASLVSRPGTVLLVHRPERRAVVRLETSDGVCYAKVVRPERAGSLALLGDTIHRLAGEAFTTPRLLAQDLRSGILLWSALPGKTLLDLLTAPRFASSAEATGRALRALHGTPPPSRVGIHGPLDEIRVLRDWLEQVRVFFPSLGSHLSAPALDVFKRLAASRSSFVLLHRDFYDKQVLIDEGHVGFLDFDTLALGEAALDLANALVHFELRALQGRCSSEQVQKGMAAFLEGYRPGPEVLSRIDVYADGVRLRLACVYAFRPSEASVVSALLTRIGSPLLQGGTLSV